MKFFHLADIHLGAVPDAGRPWSAQRAGELYESFYAVLKKAQAEHIDFVLICGDMFHRQPLQRELKELDYHFRQCAPVQIVIIAGNHDYIKENSSYVNYAWSDNVHWFTGRQCMRMYFERQGVCFYGLSYDHYEIHERLYDSLSVQEKYASCCHILLAHGGDEKHIPITWKTLAQAGFDYVALGHIHKPEIFSGGKMAYCGALEPIDKNDEGAHGFIAGEWENGHLHIQFVPWAARNYVNLKFTVNADMSWSEIKDQIRLKLSESAQDIYKIILTGYKDMGLAYDVAELYALGNVAAVKDEMAWDLDWASLYEANRGNILGRFMEKVQEMTPDEHLRERVLYYGVMALYQDGVGL